ncbi:Peroxiredoxin [Catalinimonas alkaloidigena]|uniref:thioredoxin-dependent peroxiredoxin n=2 Tax=Catalinimonas alkaloidigena TaxID=1075417 RepID=A0A1G9BRC5_9BACT|nr:Peroxiredoxin [Catalinimonas alkaloidigena]
MLLVGLLAACQPSPARQQKSSATSPEPEAEALAQYGIDAARGVPEGLSVGEMAPDFSAFDDRGNVVHLAELRQQGPVVLLFYRGHWCPVCNRYLSAFQDSLRYLTDQGAQVVAVTPETADLAEEMVAKHGLQFTVVSDSSYAIMEAYGVAFDVTDDYAGRVSRSGKNPGIAQFNADTDGAARLPIPATYVIGTDGRIRWAHVNPDYRKRASVRDIAEAL